jgi:hypothetical protein
MTNTLTSARSVTLGGLALTSVDDAGVQWMVTDLTGWRSSPASTLAVTQRPAAPGGWASANPVPTPRQMEATIAILAPGGPLLTAAYEQLLAAVGIGPVLLEVTEDGATRQAVVYRNGDVLPTGDSGAWATYSVPLIAPDPRRYGAAVALTAHLPSSSGGLSWPISWPISWPATVSYGEVSLSGGGTTDSPLLLTISGPTTGTSPLVNPLVTVTTPDGPVSSLIYTDSIGVGDQLVIDCDAKTVLYNGSGRRNFLQVVGGWPSIPPAGALASFRAGSYDATSQMTITYRPAWQ